MPSASAEASWKVPAMLGLARGIGTGSIDLAGAFEAISLGEAAFSAALVPSSSSSFDLDLKLNKAAKNPRGPLMFEASSPRFSISARASSYPLSGLPSEGICTVRPSGKTRAN